MSNAVGYIINILLGLALWLGLVLVCTVWIMVGLRAKVRFSIFYRVTWW